MAPIMTFLSLPREVRDEIYGHYVTADCGYVCDSKVLFAKTLNVNSSGSSSSPEGHFLDNVAAVLKRRDGLPADLGLTLTCKLVAEEMRGITLRNNTIIFSTATSEELRIRALHFRDLMENIDSTQEFLFHRAGYTIPEIAREELTLAYPQFARLLENLEKGYPLVDVLQRRGPYGEAPSQYRAFCREALAATSVDEIRRDGDDIRQRYSAWKSAMRRSLHVKSLDTIRIAQCPVPHWTIPSDDVVKSLEECVQPEDTWPLLCAKTEQDRSNYRFSAAAVAVHFLQSIPKDTRRQIRSIILDEDREANPNLRIERRVNLWRNGLQPDSIFGTPSKKYQASVASHSFEDRQITTNVSQWVMEALALAPAGMPSASFALVLDGQPVPDLCAEMFQKTVQRDVAWQAAWFESVERGIVPATEWFLVQVDSWNPLPRVDCLTGYFYKGFPRAMRDIVEGRSVARCNFDPGETWNVERIVQDHQTWSPERWQAAWADHEPREWFPVAPLPDFKALLEEDLVPRSERRRRRQIQANHFRVWFRRVELPGRSNVAQNPTI